MLARLNWMPRPRRIVIALALLLGLGTAVSALGGLGSSDGGDVAPSVSGTTGGGDALTVSAMSEAGRAAAPKRAADESRPAAGAALGAPSRTGEPMPSPDLLGGQAVPAGATSPTPSGRVVKSAVLSIDVAKDGVNGASGKVLEWVGQVGGFVQSSESGKEHASLVIKVPSGRLEETVARLRGLGKVTSETLAGDDVSQEYVDLEARLRHWRAQEAVFLGLMARAKTIPETVQIQQQLSVIQEQIEQLEGRRRYLDDQTSFSTVRLSLLEMGAAAQSPDHPPTTLARAWERATGAALSVVGGTLVVLGVLFPLSVLAGVVALAIAVARRRSRPAAPVAPAV